MTIHIAPEGPVYNPDADLMALLAEAMPTPPELTPSEELQLTLDIEQCVRDLIAAAPVNVYEMREHPKARRLKHWSRCIAACIRSARGLRHGDRCLDHRLEAETLLAWLEARAADGTPHAVRVVDYMASLLPEDDDGFVELYRLASAPISSEARAWCVSAKSPADTAATFLRRRFPDGRLRFYAGVWYIWDGSAHRPEQPNELRDALWAALRDAVDADGGGKFTPKPADVSAVLNALQPLASVQDAQKLYALTNGTMDLTDPEDRRGVQAVNPRVFVPARPAFAFDPEATCPVWHRFLQSVWPDQPDIIDAVQEMLGCLISGDTTHQKVFIVTGPPRSGKGTLAKVIKDLVGADNYCTPTLRSLGDRFGEHALVGKTVAVVTDARVGKSTDIQETVATLLAISGGDDRTVSRKHITDMQTKLPVRFVVMANELPKLTDNAGAFLARAITLPMAVSHVGREDLGLAAKLETELPAIFNWALIGLDRLRERGMFVQPESGAAQLAKLKVTTAPILAFLSDRCTVGADLTVAKAELFAAWGDWCGDADVQPGTEAAFGKQLATALPELKVGRPRGPDGGRVQVYTGVALAAR